MKFPQFSIRFTLFAVISLLNILIAALVWTGAYQSWDNLQKTQQISRDSVVVNTLYNVGIALSSERRLFMAAINTPQESAQVFLEELANNRREADANMTLALARIQSGQNVALADAVARARTSYMALQSTRYRLDKELTVPGELQTSVMGQVSFNAISAAITDIKHLIEVFSQPIFSLNTVVSQHMRFKHAIWEITEYAGREYTTIGSLIADNRIATPEIQNQLLSWKNRAEHNWEISALFAESSGLYDTMKPYIEEAQTHYFFTFDQIKDMFYRAGSAPVNPPYPISLAIWLEMASQAVESLITLKDISLQETQDYINKLERKAWENISFNILLLAITLILSLYTWRVIVMRVIRPVNAMIDTMVREVHRTAVNTADIDKGEDEIGKLASVLTVFQENSRRIEQTSRDLEEHRNYLKTIFEATLDAIIAINENGFVTEWNRQAEEVFGWSRDESIGRNMADLIIPPSFRPAHENGMKRFLSEGESHILNRRIELNALRKQGGVFPIELSVTAMKVGEHHHFIAFIRDITQRRKAEEDREIYMTSLENSNRELDDFAYIASHDLKEPLRGLHNFSRFLLEDYSEKLDDEGKNMLNTIADLTKRMDELLSSLLHYSRLGRTELSVRETNLNEIVQNVIDMYSIKIRETNTDIKILEPLPNLVCDHVRIAEVFQNLISNALKYSDSPNRKIEVGLTTDHPQHPGTPVYFVRDNGIGIDPRNLESIFKIFRRLHPHGAYGGGTGSGLTIAKKIINQHGGKIWAESKGKGEGTIFYFTIPPQEQSKASPAA